MKSQLKNIIDKFSKLIFALSILLVVFGVMLHFIVSNRLPITDIKTINTAYINNLSKNTSNITPENKSLQVQLTRGIFCLNVGAFCSDSTTEEAQDNRGVFGSLGSMAYLLSTPPASGIQNIQNTMANAGLIPSAYAAEGIGFAGLKPIRNIWIVFRDISFTVIVMYVLVIGFLIMFRTKLNPQTIISAENSLPRVVSTLILISFSFAIAGFMIDLMYVAMAVIIASLKGQNMDFYNVLDLQNKYLSASPMIIDESLYPRIMTNDSPDAGVFINGILNFFLPINLGAKLFTSGIVATSILNVFPDSIRDFFYSIGSVVSLLIANAMSGDLGWIGKGIKVIKGINIMGTAATPLAELLSIFASFVLWKIFAMIAVPALMALLVLCTTIVLFFRIFFMLFSSYIKIIMFSIFSPIFLLMNIIPGNKAFESWIKNMFGEIMTFVVTTTLFVVGFILVNTLYVSSVTSAMPGSDRANSILVIPGTYSPMWVPPYLMGINQSALALLIGYGVLYSIPNIVKMLKEAIGIKKSPLNIGLGTFLGAAPLAVGSVAAMGLQYATILNMIPMGPVGQNGQKSGLLGYLGGKVATALTPFAKNVAGSMGGPPKP